MSGKGRPIPAPDGDGWSAGLDAMKQPIKAILSGLDVGRSLLKTVLGTTMHQSQR
jgi:hypothetical protein